MLIDARTRPDRNPFSRKSDILLVGIGPLRGAPYAAMLNRAALQGTLVVVAAGNDDRRQSGLFIQPRLSNSEMIVSAVDENDAPLAYAPGLVPGLAALLGPEIAGSWTLGVMDLSQRDTGSFNRWTLELSYEPPSSGRG